MVIDLFLFFMLALIYRYVLMASIQIIECKETYKRGENDKKFMISILSEMHLFNTKLNIYHIFH